MIRARTLPALHEALAALPRPVALVATMGALHAGHLALIDAAREAARSVVASIFVNPLQFAADEDFGLYPRDEAGDLRALGDAGCEVAWLPSVETMYPPGGSTTIDVAGPALGFEGAIRPGHFRGVATVVGKLLHQVAPDTVLFGEKDWQQVQVVRQVTEDLSWPVRVVAVPTVREADGLAMSSRNRFLGAGEREAAPVLFRVLQQTAAALRAQAPDALASGAAALLDAGFALDYVALVDPRTLGDMTRLDRPARLLAAARLGRVRLLDNISVVP